LNASLEHPRELFKSEILSNAVSILFGHNHLIIGDERYVSLKEKGHLSRSYEDV